MNVNIQTVKFDADKRLVEFVEHKLAKMDRFAERSTGADVVLKLDKDFDKGNKVAFIGSANFSLSALELNGETITVFTSTLL